MRFAKCVFGTLQYFLYDSDIPFLQQCVQITKELLPWSRCEYIVHNTMVETIMGDYRSSAIRPNAQISQIFDLAKSDALPHFFG